MTDTIPFAGLAPDARTLRYGGDLSSFDFQAAIQVGQALSLACAGDLSDVDVATRLVDLVNAFEQTNGPACVLVRAFAARTFSELPADAGRRARARAGDDAPHQTFLLLLASRGLEPAWNDVQRSSEHGVFGLDADPMATELVRQLHVADPQAPAATTFYIADASASAAVPAKDFVTAYGVRSVIGFGVTPWPGESLVVIAFLRVFVERATARSFETVALYAKLAWLGTREARARFGPERYDRLRSGVLGELVSSHENLLTEAFLLWRRRSEDERNEARQAADEDRRKLEGYNDTLRRSQRAMLNVIEDLREARRELASKVELRTRELAKANAALEVRNQELEEFVYIASHDLQEPLRTVVGYLQMIQRRYANRLSSEADEFIRFSVEGAQRMQALIESLLVYSRVARKEKTFGSLALDEVLDEALENLALLRRETGASIERTPLPRVHADRIQMVQLFQNLVANALKFSGDAPPRVHISGELSAGQCRIVVRDEGIGFESKYVDRIFKVFRRLRRDRPGTGIGLAVCKKIAERHGGRIEAHSSPGQGATFVVHFPAEQSLTGES